MQKRLTMSLDTQFLEGFHTVHFPVPREWQSAFNLESSGVIERLATGYVQVCIGLTDSVRREILELSVGGTAQRCWMMATYIGKKLHLGNEVRPGNRRVITIVLIAKAKSGQLTPST
jgi:hypothetical protein